MRIKQQHVRRLNLIDISVPLKLLSHFCTQGRDGEVERIHVLDFWCGSQPVPVRPQDSGFGIGPIGGGARPLGQIGWIDHGVVLT